MVKHRYNVGDKVLVRADLVAGNRYDHCLFVREQRKFMGHIVTIKEHVGLSRERYYIEEDEDRWFFSAEMFDGLMFESDSNVPIEDKSLYELLGDF